MKTEYCMAVLFKHCTLLWITADDLKAPAEFLIYQRQSDLVTLRSALNKFSICMVIRHLFQESLDCDNRD